ncbi:hypothetical protein NEHOM01_1919 [Nematocida homosporus]|uniref:uncharacterized protein n=1 Tax=Nematocida homosporus TaxID=1912981 RepID=UPI00221F0AE6|nr:uncharacterized protein NEHOM01_1919 [Nematocida homosporus]KAI5187086.1 hypothetical protein NEHOM01_1919 [Nematocida homosporus]
MQSGRQDDTTSGTVVIHASFVAEGHDAGAGGADSFIGSQPVINLADPDNTVNPLKVVTFSFFAGGWVAAVGLFMYAAIKAYIVISPTIQSYELINVYGVQLQFIIMASLAGLIGLAGFIYLAWHYYETGIGKLVESKKRALYTAIAVLLGLFSAAVLAAFIWLVGFGVDRILENPSTMGIALAVGGGLLAVLSIGHMIYQAFVLRKVNSEGENDKRWSWNAILSVIIVIVIAAVAIGLVVWGVLLARHVGLDFSMTRTVGPVTQDILNNAEKNYLLAKHKKMHEISTAYEKDLADNIQKNKESLEKLEELGVTKQNLTNDLKKAATDQAREEIQKKINDLQTQIVAHNDAAVMEEAARIAQMDPHLRALDQANELAKPLIKKVEDFEKTVTSGKAFIEKYGKDVAPALENSTKVIQDRLDEALIDLQRHNTNIIQPLQREYDAFLNTQSLVADKKKIFDLAHEHLKLSANGAKRLIYSNGSVYAVENLAKQPIDFIMYAPVDLPNAKPEEVLSTMPQLNTNPQIGDVTNNIG